MKQFTIARDDSILVLVDIQERLTVVMGERQKVTTNCLHLIEAANLLDIPIILTEQYPKGLGHTISQIREALPAYSPIEKTAFNCCDEPSFINAIEKTGRKTVLLTGMETHVCILQTCLGLLEKYFTVHVVKDAVCSRTKDNFNTGIEMQRDAGAVITSTEIALFQLLKEAGTEEFKTISRLIK